MISKTSHPPRPKRVLVADDEHLVVTSLSSSLRSLGYEVVGPVADGNAALRVIESEPAPDLALLDIRMPGPDGLEVAKRLWQEHEVPSIIISAYSGAEHVQRAQDAGVFGYLIKPVNAESLGAQIAVAWSKYCIEIDQMRRVQQLETTLEDRRIVEQAKWKLVEVNGLNEASAHAALQKAARNQRKRLREIAQGILDATVKPISLD